MTEPDDTLVAPPPAAGGAIEGDALPVPAGEDQETLPAEYPEGSHELMESADGSPPAALDEEEDAESTPARTQPAETAPDLRDIPITDLHEIANIRPQYYGLDDLRESMRVQGQLEAAMVRRAPPGAHHDKPWELVFGYRRKRAAEMLEWTHLRCEVRNLENMNVLDVMITENLQREDLSAIAEAKAMKALVELGGMSQAAVARRLGKDPSHVSHRLQLLGLSAPIMEQIDKGEISASHGEVIASLPEAQQERFASKAAAGNISVSKLTSWVRKAKQELEEEPPDDPEDLMPVTADDVVQIPHVALRNDLGADDMARLNAYVLLRSANDQEMLEYLEDKHELPFEGLWPWVSGLSAEDAHELSRRLVRRYVEAGHRFGSIDPQLVDEVGDREIIEGRGEFVPTPSLSDGDIEPEDGALDGGGWLPPAGFDDDHLTHALPSADGEADPWAPAALPAAQVKEDPDATTENPWGLAALPSVPGVDDDIAPGGSLLSPLPSEDAGDDAGDDWIGALRVDGPGLLPDEDDDRAGDEPDGVAGAEAYAVPPVDEESDGQRSNLDADDGTVARSGTESVEADGHDEVGAKLVDGAGSDAHVKPETVAAEAESFDPAIWVEEPIDYPAEISALRELPIVEEHDDDDDAEVFADSGDETVAVSAPMPTEDSDTPEGASAELSVRHDDQPAEVDTATLLMAALRERQPDLAADKAGEIAERTAATGDPLPAVVSAWLTSGAFPTEPRVGDISPALLEERMGKPSLVFSALCALHDDPERARAAIARIITPAPAPFDMGRVVAALVERQGLDADKARTIVLRVEAADRQIQDAVMAWLRDGEFPTEPVISGQTPASLAAHVDGKSSMVMSALVALRENPSLVLERLGISAPA